LRRHLFAAQGVDLLSNDYLRLSSHPEVKYRTNQESAGMCSCVELYKKFIGRNLLLRPLGNVLYFMPPYVISEEETHWALDQIEEVVQSLGRQAVS